LDCDFLSNFEVRHAFAELYYCTGEFVADCDGDLLARYGMGACRAEAGDAM
jgi:hypothetical protein